MEAAFIPEVKDELDTQNFEKFEEVLLSVQIRLLVSSLKSLKGVANQTYFVLQAEHHTSTSSKSSPWRKVLFMLKVFECIFGKMFYFYICYAQIITIF